MKVKFLVIFFLLIILAAVIYQMISMEDARRETTETVQVEEFEPPLQLLSREELIRLYPQVNYYSMASGDYFRVLQPGVAMEVPSGVWKDIYLKGVNLGVAMPGYFPVEFSLTFNDYLSWFRDIGQMNANVVRTYTILPPEFYEALAYYNLNNQHRKLYLLQGVWAEEPADRNYLDPRFIRRYEDEIRRAVDVINGNAYLKPQGGHATGVYVSNVSKYVIGLLLGREWEPKSVLYTDDVNKGTSQYTGNFVTINNGTPMEVWLARMMDFTVHYETQTYMMQHPVSFVNWLPLDPMFHNYEYTDSDKIREYDNDLVSLDFTRFNATELFDPGIFAAYHVYPYYPDYIYLEDKYKGATNRLGDPDNFLGYLADLKNHNPSLPLVIAEYGLPSSRGISHYALQGFHQGGHSELQQAHLSAILTDDIHESGCAGGLYFEWIDEWFKHNWLVMDFEQPAERGKLWHNLENPEQNYGIMAVESRTRNIDGKPGDWPGFSPKPGKTIMIAHADPAWFYLAMQLPGFDFKNNNLYVAFDTYDKKKGDHKLPFGNGKAERGIEFLLRITSTSDARILVDDQYSIYTDVVKNIIPVYASKENDNGIFINQLLLANRGKVTILGEKVDSVCFDRSILQHGISSRPGQSNADWFWNNANKILELRLTWPLLNVSDPSSRAVLDDVEGTPEIEYSETPGFYLYYFITDKKDNIADMKTATGSMFYTWDKWEMPDYTTRLKPLYDTLKAQFARLEPPAKDAMEPSPDKQEFRICDFYENKSGAVSITFDDADYSQFEYALPVLGKYNMKANFGIVSDWLNDAPSLIAEEGSFAIKRLGLPQVQDIIYEGHEVSFHGNTRKVYGTMTQQQITEEMIRSKQQLQSRLEAIIPVIHYPYSEASDKVVNAARNAGFLFGRAGGDALAPGDNVNTDPMRLSSVVFLNAQTPGTRGLDSILTAARNSWTILLYNHLFPEVSKEYKLYAAHNVTNTYTVPPVDFVKQIRLIRNSGYWIAPISDIGKYIRERKASTIRSTSNNNSIFLRVDCRLNTEVFNHPLTIELKTSHRKFRITNCAADGVYNAFGGKLYFNVYPNQDVTIEILDL